MALFGRKDKNTESNSMKSEEIIRYIENLVKNNRAKEALKYFSDVLEYLPKEDIFKLRSYLLTAVQEEMKNATREVNRASDTLTNTAAKFANANPNYQRMMDAYRQSGIDADRRRAEILNSINEGRRR